MSTSSKPRIRSIQRDPMGARPIERRYERRLFGLLADYKGLVRKTVERFTVREMGAPARIPVDLRTMITSIQQIGHITIEQNADTLAQEMAVLTYTQGRKWADRAISVQGYRPPDDKGPAPSSLLYFLPADKKAIARIKQRNLTEIKGVSDDMAKRMSRTLVDAFERRETIRAISRRIDEVTAFGRVSATRIARTETMRALNDASMERYQEVGIDRVQWVTGGEDGRTCEDCLALHMKVFDIGSAPYLPLHPNCRCTTVAVIGKE